MDEKLNALTHGIGLLLTLIGTPILIIESIRLGNVMVSMAVGLFCISMICMYFSSTYYHLAINYQLKKLWHKIDHVSIFALIGGTYTPFIFIYYSGKNGWTFLAVLWSIIVMGMIFKIVKTEKYRFVSALLYLILGWLIVVIYKPVTSEMADHVLYLLLFGGLSYSVGVIFYLWRRIKFHHAIWHIFVIGGTLGHFLSIYYSM